MSRLERVGDVLQKEEAEDNVLVLRSVDLSTQRVRGLPEFVGVGQVGGGCTIVRHVGLRSLLFGCQTLGRTVTDSTTETLRVEPHCSKTLAIPSALPTGRAERVGMNAVTAVSAGAVGSTSATGHAATSLRWGRGPP